MCNSKDGLTSTRVKPPPFLELLELSGRRGHHPGHLHPESPTKAPNNRPEDEVCTSRKEDGHPPRHDVGFKTITMYYSSHKPECIFSLTEGTPNCRKNLARIIIKESENRLKIDYNRIIIHFNPKK